MVSAVNCVNGHSLVSIKWKITEIKEQNKNIGARDGS